MFVWRDAQFLSSVQCFSVSCFVNVIYTSAPCSLLTLGWWRCLELDVPFSHSDYVTKAVLVQRQRQFTTSPPKAEFISCKLALVSEEYGGACKGSSYCISRHFEHVMMCIEQVAFPCLFTSMKFNQVHILYAIPRWNL